MMIILRKYWWVLLLISLMAIIPLFVNWLILQPQRFNFVGDGTHWLGFWATYISSIASFAMVYITSKTLKQNKKTLSQNTTALSQNDTLIGLNQKLLNQNKEQLDELKRQWEDANRPHIQVSAVKYQELVDKFSRSDDDSRTLCYCLKVKNVGNRLAENIRILFNDEFVNGINDIKIKEYIQSFQFKSYNIISNDDMLITLFDYFDKSNKGNCTTDKLEVQEMKLTTRYWCGDREYETDFSIDIGSITNKSTSIEEITGSMNIKLVKITESLQCLAKNCTSKN